jgi:hypothetical protein
MRRAVLRAHVWLLAFAVPVLVRVLPLRAVLWVMAPPRWWRPYRGVPPEAIAATVRRRLARPRQMKRRACLREGLLVFHFLCLAGHEPVIRFAVFPPQPAPRAVHAHCWVTLDGRPCSAPPEGPSAELMRYARATGVRPASRS